MTQPEEITIDEQGLKYLAGMDAYLTQLEAGLEKDPVAWLDTLEKNKAELARRIRHIQGVMGTLSFSARYLEHLDLAKLREEAALAGTFEQHIARLEALNTGDVLVRTVEDILHTLKDAKFTESVRKILVRISGLGEEMKLIEAELASVEALEQQWQSGGMELVERARQIFERLQRELPHLLEEKFHDTATADYLKTLTRNEEDFKPIPHPTALKHVLQRVQAKLQDREGMAGRVTNTKEEITTLLRARKKSVTRSLTREIDNIKNALLVLKRETGRVMMAVDLDADARISQQEILARKVRLMIDKIVLNRNMLEELHRNPQDTPELRAKVLKYCQRYKELLQEEDKLDKSLGTLLKALKPREELLQDSVEEFTS